MEGKTVAIIALLILIFISIMSTMGAGVAWDAYDDHPEFKTMNDKKHSLIIAIAVLSGCSILGAMGLLVFTFSSHVE